MGRLPQWTEWDPATRATMQLVMLHGSIEVLFLRWSSVWLAHEKVTPTTFLTFCGLENMMTLSAYILLVDEAFVKGF